MQVIKRTFVIEMMTQYHSSYTTWSRELLSPTLNG